MSRLLARLSVATSVAALLLAVGCSDDDDGEGGSVTYDDDAEGSGGSTVDLDDDATDDDATDDDATDDDATDDDATDDDAGGAGGASGAGSGTSGASGSAVAAGAGGEGESGGASGSGPGASGSSGAPAAGGGGGAGGEVAATSGAGGVSPQGGQGGEISTQGGAGGVAPRGGAGGAAPQGGVAGVGPQGGVAGVGPQGGAGGEAPVGEAMTIDEVEDSQINESSEEPLGEETVLVADGQDSDFDDAESRFLVKPAVAALDVLADRTILLAELVLTSVGDDSDELEVRALDGDWSEADVTYADAPESGEVLATITGDDIAVGVEVRIDLTELAQQWVESGDAFGVIVADTGPNGADFASSEADEGGPRFEVRVEEE